jgi:hypothetical protein
MDDMQGKEEQRLKIKNPGVFITVLNDYDVLQGRGSGSMQNTGNIRFRTMVEELRPAYVATSSRKEKAKMITSMVKLIQSRQGRFLQRLNDGEVDKLGLSSNTEHFVEMTDAEAAEKAKQAIRYVHYKKVPLEDKRRKKRAAGIDPPNGNAKSSRNKDTMIDNGGGNTNNIPMNMAAEMSLPNIVNQGVGGIQSQQMASVPGLNNMNSMAQFRPQQLQQAQLGQMLASLQDTTKPFAAEPTLAIGQLQQFSAQHQQQASLLGTLQPNALQQLTSSLLSTNNLPQPLAATPTAQQQTSALLNAGPQNNQQNLQQQQQLNALLQNLLHQNQSQQQNLQSDTIIQSLLHQQQQQQLLGALQHQQRLNSTIQTLQQVHQPNSNPQLQQQSQQQQQQQQQQTNPMLALLSNASQKSPANSALSSFINQSLPTSTTNQQLTPQQQQQQQATNSFLSSMLSNPSSSSSNHQQSNTMAPGGASVLLSPTPLSPSLPGTGMMTNGAGQVNMGG